MQQHRFANVGVMAAGQLQDGGDQGLVASPFEPLPRTVLQHIFSDLGCQFGLKGEEGSVLLGKVSVKIHEFVGLVVVA